MERRILYIFTRTPLHVGAGASVGAIDQPIIRERHTGFPIIPASSLKGTFADGWNSELASREYRRVIKKGDEWDADTDAAWLFGSDDANHAFAGALQFSEARLLAFPIRSAKGSFAWITCPLILARAARDGVTGIAALTEEEATCFSGAEADNKAIFLADGPLALKVRDGNAEQTHVVLEEYTFNHADDPPNDLGNALKRLLPDDHVWREVADRLVILSNGMVSFFARNACDVAQHVRISDETGTADPGGLFNQENVPSETMFYSMLHAFAGRGEDFNGRTSKDAWKAFTPKLKAIKYVLQFGGDASTGLGYCTVAFDGNGA